MSLMQIPRKTLGEAQRSRAGESASCVTKKIEPANHSARGI